ncbi:MAG: tyrosine-type recombinase/integrase [Sulfolobales archaeon]|nr:tyrosine-type recombinase/integrase [Sulfolobales archaeon]MCX8198486.1 tyrosine-type recombinase/integrase [Sulfolobales archaeon]MDW8169561.1 site-specific integrase [Desulfurococcaceae archaeon]
MPNRVQLSKPSSDLLSRSCYEVLEEFLSALVASGASDSTVKAYRAAIVDFLNFVGSRDLLSITLSDLNKWRIERLRKGFPKSRSGDRASWATTLHYYSIFIRRFFEWLGIDLKVASVKKPPRKVDVLSESDVSRLLNASVDLLDLIVLKLMLEAGLRSRELVGLRLSDIDFESGEVTVREAKYGKIRKVLVTEEVLELLKKWSELRKLKPMDRVIPLSYSGLYKRVKKIASRAGLDPRVVRPHVLRHTFATLALKKGLDVFSLRRLMGHSDLKTTEAYVHLTLEDLKDSYRRIFESKRLMPNVSEVRYCPMCGGESVPGAKYCIHCGHELPTASLSLGSRESLGTHT